MASILRKVNRAYLTKTSFFVGIISGLFCGCASSTLNLQSSPSQADIYASSLGDAPRLIGQTPLIIKSKDLSKDNGGSGPVTVEMRKPGYTPAKTLITDVSAMDITLNVDLSPIDADDDRLNTVIDLIFESQRLARAGRSEEALVKLKTAEKEAPQLAATYELEGGIYYIQKKYKDALDAYNLASKYNPKNSDATRMRDLLEKSLAVTRKSSLDSSSSGSSTPQPVSNETQPTEVQTPPEQVPVGEKTQ